MTESPVQKKPSIAKYICVWVLAAFTAGIAIRVVDLFLVYTLFDVSNPTKDAYWTLAPILEYAAWACVIIGIYSYFDSLLVGKVIPWIMVLGGLGVILAITKTYAAFSNSGLSLSPLFAVSSLISFGFAVFAINHYFKVRQPHRY
ncbi:hypothetical protein [Ruegeria atlantica]|uniref:hypothetical protein n=1 Tax=Ruegeria atlantica TaxID=81569 RepID=UPI002495271E|nr:hypothetical protein [Ruegeria atlantica]